MGGEKHPDEAREKSRVLVMEVVAKCSSLLAMDGRDEVSCCSKGSFAIFRGVDDARGYCIARSVVSLVLQTQHRNYATTCYIRARTVNPRKTCADVLTPRALSLAMRRNMQAKTVSTHLPAIHGSLDQTLWLQICARAHLCSSSSLPSIAR